MSVMLTGLSAANTAKIWGFHLFHVSIVKFCKTIRVSLLGNIFKKRRHQQPGLEAWEHRGTDVR
jgi:hypothetical protein